MATPLTLKLILAGAAKAVGELKPLDKQSKATADSLKKSRDALKLLNGQLGQIDGMRKQQAALGQQSNALKVLRTNLDTVTQSHGQAVRLYGPHSEAARKLRGDLTSLTAEVNKAAAAHDKQRAKLMQMRAAATGTGIKNLTADQSRLKAEVQATTAAIAQQKSRLEALAHMNARRADLGQRLDRTRATAGHLAVAGAGGLGAAYGVRRAVNEPLHQIRSYDTVTERIAALGLGKEDTDRAIRYAKQMKTFGTSMNDNLGLMLDATTAFADVHHAEMVMPTLAKMKFANHAMFGEAEGADNERKFLDMLRVIELRGGLASESAFKGQADMVQRVITATGGRIGPEEWLNFIKTGGVAAKGLSDSAMYYQLEALISEMGGNRVGTATMSAYQNLYQGRTTKRAAKNIEALGLIGDPSKVKHDKVGQVSYLNPGALKGSDLFRENQFEWMEQVLLPALAKKGITEKNQVLDTIGSIFSNRTASNLFAQMYLQRDQIRKNARLNAGADGIQSLDQKARNIVSGREVETLSRFHDAMQQAGTALLPTYIGLLDSAANAMQRITEFAKQNPVMATYIGKGVLWLGLLTAGFGALTIALAALLGPFAVVRYGLGLFGIKAAALSPLLTVLGTGLRMAGTAVLWLGRALLTTPIGLAITGIATAAFLIYKYWQPIKGFFSDLWNGVLAFMLTLPARMLQAGADMMTGLVNGITSKLAAVRDAIGNAADGAIGWFKDKLGIHSPSRVFIEAGRNVGEGAAIGIDRTRPLLRAAALGLAGATAVGMPAMATSFDTRPPLSAGAGRAAPIVIQGDTVTIQINAGPGTDTQALARAISAELDRRERDKQARAARAFVDYNNG
ncbi:MAG: hypothetical protein GAK30_01567 [Paracidovorax wautersii]|uniref:Phage tail tape measure protein, TP901 family, core region n=1 Tax=Paracidovorax wautersii TaxID=1177982 RepID=A0A7V8JQW9_9BURK|nr:MAG: hypothetical protein GAK30_01567 [Paracidovorax wautersii]